MIKIAADCIYLIESVYDDDVKPLREAVLSSKTESVILDLSGCNKLYSLPIGIIIHLTMEMKKEGRRLILRNIPRNVMDIFERTNLNTFFDFG